MIGEVNITEAEAALYDRQIRLWGLDAQKRLRGASVLLIGLGGVGAEIAKNIILSGVKAITLLDHAPVTDSEKCFQFLIAPEDSGKNRAESSRERAQQLNPMVEVEVDTGRSEEKDAEFFRKFSVVCATGCTLAEMERIDMACRDGGVQFFAGDVFGFYGFMFSDLNKHEYSEEVISYKKKEKSTESFGEPSAKKPRVEPEMKTVKKTSEFTSLKEALTFDWTTPASLTKLRRNPPTAYFIARVLLEFRARTGRTPCASTRAADTKLLGEIRAEKLKELSVNASAIPDNFVEFCMSEFNPVCAILGGVIAAEVIKAVSLKDTPINNFFFYNGLDGCGSVDKL